MSNIYNLACNYLSCPGIETFVGFIPDGTRHPRRLEVTLRWNKGLIIDKPTDLVNAKTQRRPDNDVS